MTQRNRRHERGIAMLFVLLSLIALIGLGALALQWAQLALTQAALQDYVDARAVSAIQDRFGADLDPVTPPRALEHFALPLEGHEDEPECGGWDHDDAAFQAATPCASASGVPAHRVTQAIRVPLLFSSFAALVDGEPEATLEASATSFIPRRQVALVQDISGSLDFSGRGGLPGVQRALRRVVGTMRDQDLPGDHVGLVTFGDTVESDVALTPLSSPNALSDAIEEISGLQDSERRWNTCTSGGIAAGRAMLEPIGAEYEVSPLMIVVTDGIAGTNCGTPGASGSPPDAAAAQAAAACGADIDVHVIAVTGGDSSLETNLNRFDCPDNTLIPVTNLQGVEDAVVQILTQTRVRLVE